MRRHRTYCQWGTVENPATLNDRGSLLPKKPEYNRRSDHLNYICQQNLRPPGTSACDQTTNKKAA